MSASAVALPNGILPPPAQSVDEALEYEKILRIRDEVFSGTHPRLTVPAHAIRVPSSQNSSALSQNQLHVPSPSPATPSPNRLEAGAQSNKREDELTQPHNKPNGVPAPPGGQPTPSVSEFDPVLLTKSDDLIRAETLLKRQRLEKALRDQFEQKRADARKRPAPAEAKPDFDLPAIFARVTGTAKSPSAKDEEEATDSVNEDEFYSSRAPDSTPEGPPSDSPDEADEEQADESSGLRAVSAVMGAPLYPDADDPISAPVTLPAPAAAEPTKPLPPPDPTAMDVDDEEEEGEYSPPEAAIQVPSPKAPQAEDIRDSRDPRSRPLRRYSEVEDMGPRPPSPSEARMRIVRNHITSPVAPRPSRVSPLAVTKDSPLSQNARSGRKQWIGRPGSPPSPDDNQTLPARKRRKLEGRNQKRQARRNGRMSPDVKEEDISPPPFHDVQPLGTARLHPGGADRPIILDDESAQEVRYAVPPHERYVESPARPLPRQVERLMPSSEPRPLSRSSMRPGRDDQDLRRVASMHTLRAEQPRDYVDPYYDTPTRTRAASYARTGSPAITESGRPLRELPVEYDHPRPPVYRDVYDERDGTYHRYVAEPLPPPVERIIVDQYGRRFREIVHERQSVAPREVPIRREVEPVYEQYPRQGRAGSVFVDSPQERAYGADMPPPPVSYRRVADPPRASAVASPVTREYLEPAPPMRSASVQMMERPVRQTMYPDERAEFREPVRAGSVRPPPATRYEEGPPMEMIPRGLSVRPVGREGSVFMDDRRPLAPEYAPMSDPRYRPMEPERRYIDVDGREIIQPDGAMDSRLRVMDRY
ncbi:hypothetical protein CLCR_03874 [Cladophialophora carrionii]|uniref:Uncharacterized protein n=1 Tax=Cladophialophora carrionii TaxID=86049 RepID=A0A1C1CJB4_9EURO|nr:hypothetical protein CLCR_03874 [Cladophialophora carrionii]